LKITRFYQKSDRIMFFTAGISSRLINKVLSEQGKVLISLRFARGFIGQKPRAHYVITDSGSCALIPGLASQWDARPAGSYHDALTELAVWKYRDALTVATT